MKNILKNIIPLLAAAVLAACSAEPLKTFDQSTSVYFASTVGGLDSTMISYAFQSADRLDSTVRVTVKIMGNTAAYDRPFRVVVDPASTAVEGVDFASLGDGNYVAANSAIGYVTIKTLRSAALKNVNNVKLQLKLEPNQYFTTDVKQFVYNVSSGARISALDYKVVISENIKRPPIWGTNSSSGVPKSVFLYLGEYSVRKFTLLCTTMNVDPSYFDATSLVVPGKITLSDVIYYASYMKRYLKDMKSQGMTVMDMNDTTGVEFEMAMGTSAS